jgi:hypothetical protein
VDGAGRDGSGFVCWAFHFLEAAVFDPLEEAGAKAEPKAQEALSIFSCLFFSFLDAAMASLREVEAAIAEGFLECLSPVMTRLGAVRAMVEGDVVFAFGRQQSCLPKA